MQYTCLLSRLPQIEIGRDCGSAVIVSGRFMARV